MKGLGWMVLVTALWAVGPQQLEAPAPLAAEDVILAQLEAFNAHDVEALTANLSPDFAWFAVDSDRSTLELAGTDTFRRSMLEYFYSVPSARAEIVSMVADGAFVAVREVAYWEEGGQMRSQSSLAVYEIRDSLIYRVWYYPAGP